MKTFRNEDRKVQGKPFACSGLMKHGQPCRVDEGSDPVVMDQEGSQQGLSAESPRASLCGRAGPLWKEGLHGKGEGEAFPGWLSGRGVLVAVTCLGPEELQGLRVASGKKNEWGTGGREKVRKTWLPRPPSLLVHCTQHAMVPYSGVPGAVGVSV